MSQLAKTPEESHPTYFYHPQLSESLTHPVTKGLEPERNPMTPREPIPSQFRNITQFEPHHTTYLPPVTACAFNQSQIRYSAGLVCWIINAFTDSVKFFWNNFISWGSSTTGTSSISIEGGWNTSPPAACSQSTDEPWWGP